MEIYSQPDPFLPPDERTPEWWKENVRWGFSYYNRSNPKSRGKTKPLNINSRTGTIGQGEGGPPVLSPVDEILRYIDYYLGKQDNQTYYYTAQEDSNCATPTVWVAGQKITPLVDFMLGKFMEIAGNMDPTVKTTSQAAQNRKTMLLEKALLKIQVPEVFADMASYGVDFSPMGGSEAQFKTEEDLMRYMEIDYRENAEILAVKLANDIMLRNRAIEKYKQQFLYTLIAGYVGQYNYVENGKPYYKTILPQHAIIDTDTDDDLHRSDKLAGFIEWLTPTQVIQRHGKFLNQEQQEEIKSMNSSKWTSLTNCTDGSSAWFYMSGNTPMYGVVTLTWKGFKDLRYEESKDKFGGVHYKKTRGGKSSKYQTEIVYKAVLIGNHYLGEYGEETNQVRSIDNPGNVDLPFHWFQPNMLNGENKSIVARLHELQDRIDFLTNEMTKMITRSKGKVYLINGHKIGSKGAKDVLEDFTNIGFHVTDGAIDGEDYVPGKEDKMVEVVDYTLDPNVQLLVNLRREEERLMEEIVNIPKIALGQQTSYVGSKTQQGTIAQSTLGTAHLYQGFIQYIEKCLAHSLNQYKMVVPNEKETSIPVIGTKGKEYIKMLEDFMFEELGVYIKIRDFIDEQARRELMDTATAFAQTGLIDPIELILMRKCTTYSELMSELEYSMRKKDRQAAQKEAVAQMMAQAQNAQQIQGRNSTEQLKQSAANYRQELKTGADMAMSSEPNLEVQQ